MQLEINGAPREVAGVAHVAALVEALELPAALVLIEHNGEALHRSQWTERPLQDGDRVEILRVAAGG